MHCVFMYMISLYCICRRRALHRRGSLLAHQSRKSNEWMDTISSSLTLCALALRSAPVPAHTCTHNTPTAVLGQWVMFCLGIGLCCLWWIQCWWVPTNPMQLSTVCLAHLLLVKPPIQPYFQINPERSSNVNTWTLRYWKEHTPLAKGVTFIEMRCLQPFNALWCSTNWATM